MSTLNNNPDTNITTVVIAQTDYISASRVDINNNFGKLNSYASYVSAGLVILATASDVTSGNTKNVVTSDLLKSNVDIINSEILELSAAISGNVQTYTNLSAVPTTVGGITAGSTFNSVPITTMFDLLLYPYQTPSFSSFSYSGYSSNIEVGSSIGSNFTFNWATAYSSNVSANSVTIRDVTGGSTLISNTPNDGTEAITYGPITKNVYTSNYQMSIEARNSQGTLFSRTFGTNWVFKIYYGNSSDSSLTEAQIKSQLGNLPLQQGFSNNYSFSATSGTYKYICVPNTHGTPTSFIYAGNTVAMESPVSTSITNGLSANETYNVYRTTYPIAGALTITVS